MVILVNVNVHQLVKTWPNSQCVSSSRSNLHHVLSLSSRGRQTDLDICFPALNNGSHCSYYTEALSLEPLPCSAIISLHLLRPVP